MHNKHKKILLKQIHSYKQKNKTGWNYSDGDWSLPSTESNLTSDWAQPVEGTDRQYLNYFYNEIVPSVMDNIAFNHLGFIDYDWEITNSWFQEYTKGAEHGWHNHSGCQFTNCYYVELPDTKYKTEIIGIDGNKIEYEAQEGDIITIPSWMTHQSPPNYGERKTVIVFNSSFMVKYKTEGSKGNYGVVH